MTNKYIYFIANWKMFGNLRSLNSVGKVASFVKKFKKNKIKIKIKLKNKKKFKNMFKYV